MYVLMKYKFSKSLSLLWVLKSHILLHTQGFHSPIKQNKIWPFLVTNFPKVQGMPSVCHFQCYISQKFAISPYFLHFHPRHPLSQNFSRLKMTPAHVCLGFQVLSPMFWKPMKSGLFESHTILAHKKNFKGYFSN